MSLVLLFVMGMFVSFYVRSMGLLLNSVRLTAKTLPLVSEETLNLSVILELLRSARVLGDGFGAFYMLRQT